MRIAHISDLHVLALAGAVPFRLFNKRATGYANLRLRRNHQHKTEIVRAIAGHLSRSKIDHVVITGDVSNLALEAEFSAVRSVLDDVLALPPSAVTLVPGNHDVYTRGAQKKLRFSQYFEPYLTSDLPHLRTEQPGGRFPIVKLRGPVAIIGLSTALARLPFVASGRLGLVQLQALEKILASPEVKKRTPVVLLHHPLFNPATWTRMKAKLEGLEDAGPLRELLAPLSRGLLLHGHLHRRIHHKLTTRAGHVDVVGATSASLVHASPTRMAGYNLYEITYDGAVVGLESYVYDEAAGEFRSAPLPGPGDATLAAG
jgi:3',5'-cyclic AMP phosphodiesterase CpdA